MSGCVFCRSAGKTAVYKKYSISRRFCKCLFIAERRYLFAAEGRRPFSPAKAGGFTAPVARRIYTHFFYKITTQRSGCDFERRRSGMSALLPERAKQAIRSLRRRKRVHPKKSSSRIALSARPLLSERLPTPSLLLSKSQPLRWVVILYLPLCKPTKGAYQHTHRRI